MGIFGKKKSEEEEDVLIEKLTKGSEKPSQPESGSSGPSKGSLTADVEKIGAQISALREVLQAQQERFERQSEEIGELRSALAEREKHMRDIESKAMKAAELVEEVQPENLMSEQKKTDAKIEAIRAKIENSETVSGNIIEELKKIKSSVAIFRGMEDIIKLNKEIQDEIRDIKKIEGTVEKHADHVEAMFNSFESNFGTFEKMKDEIKALSESGSEMKKEIEKNSIAIKDTPRKDEFFQLKKSAEQTLEDIKNEKQIYDGRNAAIESKAEKACRVAQSIESGAIALKNELARNSMLLSDVTGTVNSTLEKVKKMEYEAKTLKNDLSYNAQKLDETIGVMERTAKLITEENLNGA